MTCTTANTLAHKSVEGQQKKKKCFGVSVQAQCVVRREMHSKILVVEGVRFG